MPKCLKLISYSATAPGASGAAAAALSGDSLIVENDHSSEGPCIVDLWGQNQTAGFHQVIRNTSGDNTTRDLRYRMAAANSLPLLPRGTRARLVAQEQLTITIAGSATAGDVETGCMSIWYPNLSGINANLISWSDLMKRAQNLTTVDVSITSAAAGYTEELITADSNLMKSNFRYAVLGIEADVSVAAVYIKGPDFGNVRVGMPGNLSDPQWAGGYFGELSRAHGDAEMIPTIDSGNRDNTFIGFVSNENATTVKATAWLANLGPIR